MADPTNNNGELSAVSIIGRTWKLVAESEAMQRVVGRIHEVARLVEPVLLQGEIGTGKREIARAIYELGGIEGKPWKIVSCATESPEVIEKLIFGNEDRASLIQANGGTLYLEEVNRLSETAQLRLLQVIREGRFQRPGAQRWESVSVRIIASSHQDLGKEVSEGRFREDLYWSLNVLPIEVPPLRRRRADIGPLTAQIVEKICDSNGQSSLKIDDEFIQQMVDYSFPGNLLELQAYLLRGVQLSSATNLTVEQLPVAVTGSVHDTQSVVFRPTDDASLLQEFVDSQLGKLGKDSENLFQQIVEPLERELILQVLELCDQTKTKAAKRLGINRNTLTKKLEDLGITKTKSESENQ